MRRILLILTFIIGLYTVLFGPVYYCSVYALKNGYLSFTRTEKLGGIILYPHFYMMWKSEMYYNYGNWWRYKACGIDLTYKEWCDLFK